MKYASVCDGIGAVHVAWKPLGWTCAWTSEIEAFPIAVVEQRHGLRNVGDMTKIGDEELTHGSIDLLVGGTPCQSFSVAGLRKGLADPRGNLALAFLALVDRARPRWVAWENVPGVLSSSGGRDFGAFLGALGQLGYGWAYRVLDAQYFGLAQRRKRVFVVGRLGDGNRAAAVLLERACLRGDLAPSRRAGTDIASAVTGGLGSGGADDVKAQAHHLIAGPSTAPRSGGGGSYRLDANDIDGNHVIPFDTTQITSAANVSAPRAGDPCHPLAAAAHAPAVAYPLQEVGKRESKAQHGVGVGGDEPMFTLQASAQHGVAFTQNQREEVRDLGDLAATLKAPGTHEQTFIASVPPTAPCLRSNAYNNSDATMEAQMLVPVAFQEAQTGCREYAEAGTLRANGPGHDPVGTRIREGMTVRRLTPRECERLQGFPDDYTLVIYRGAPAKDGPRYRAIGNSMAVPVMAWIGRRIAMVDELETCRASG